MKMTIEERLEAVNVKVAKASGEMQRVRNEMTDLPWFAFIRRERLTSQFILIARKRAALMHQQESLLSILSRK